MARIYKLTVNLPVNNSITLLMTFIKLELPVWS